MTTISTYPIIRLFIKLLKFIFFNPHSPFDMIFLCKTFSLAQENNLKTKLISKSTGPSFDDFLSFISEFSYLALIIPSYYNRQATIITPNIIMFSTNLPASSFWWIYRHHLTTPPPFNFMPDNRWKHSRAGLSTLGLDTWMVGLGISLPISSRRVTIKTDPISFLIVLDAHSPLIKLNRAPANTYSINFHRRIMLLNKSSHEHELPPFTNTSHQTSLPN